MKLRWEIAWGIFFGYCLILLLSFVLAMLSFLVLRLVMPDVPMIGLGNDNATLAQQASELPGLAPSAQSRLSQAFEAFAADGSAITQPFTVDRRWVVVWNSQDTAFDFDVIDVSTGRPISVVAAEDSPPSGYTQPLPRGAYYLDVRADAPWTIDLVPGSWPE